MISPKGVLFSVKNKTDTHKLILASASPRRLDLLQSIGITPASIIPANIDETPRASERPRDYALRMAIEKSITHPLTQDHFILAADTVVACGLRILPKAETIDEARFCLNLLSGRRHRVWGGIALRTPDDKIISRLVCSIVKFKSLSKTELESYLDSGEWQGKAGGYAIQGTASGFIPFISGSYSNIVGLSLFDAQQMLKSAGFYKA